MHKSLKVIMFLCACCVAYSVAWIQQDIKYKIKVSGVHMRARMIASLVLEDLLPKVSRGGDVKLIDDFIRDTMPVMVDYIVLDTAPRYQKWYEKWLLGGSCQP